LIAGSIRTRTADMGFKKVTLKVKPEALGVSFLEAELGWEPDESQRKAAWEMYVELVTRVAIVDLHPDEGTLREALTSLHSLFESTRDILRRHGPSVARAKKNHQVSFGYLAVAILNQVLRPVLSKWHPLLLDYEEERQDKTSKVAHEKAWSKSEELRKVLDDIRPKLRAYGDLLAKAAGVEPLVEDVETGR